MKEARLAELLGEVREEFAEEAMPVRKGKHTHRTAWAALAACACLALAIGLWGGIPKGKSDTAPNPGEAPAMDMQAETTVEIPEAVPETEEMESVPQEPEESRIPHVDVDGVTYYISSHLSSYDECPEGFVYKGTIEYGDFAGCDYYQNPDHPQLVYVYTMTNNDGRVDSSGTVIPTDWHMAYLRFADESMRGRSYICVDGVQYVSLASAYGVVPWAFADRLMEEYGIQLEGDLPEGFVSVGVTEFAGYDIWPTGTLSSNEAPTEVFVHPENAEVILAATEWHSVKGVHRGYQVFVYYFE